MPARILSTLLLLIALIGCDSSGPPTVDPVVERTESRASQSPRSTGAFRPDAESEIQQSIPELGLASTARIPTNVDPESWQEESIDPRFDLRFLSWNVESEGADPNVIAEELAMLNADDRFGVVGLTEVMPSDFETYRLALGEHYRFASTRSGNNDRMQLLYDTRKFEKLREFEVEEINIEGRYRAPLVLHLKPTNGGPEFLVMINHLARGKAEIRQRQAGMLVEWARDETMPVIAIGDYNFDFVFETEQGNPAFTQFMRDQIWQWVQPETWVDTNWYDNPQQPDGVDDYPGSMLDFAFVANGATEWERVCRVIERPLDFPDDETTSDHRPFELWVATGTVGQGDGGVSGQ